MDTGVHRYTLIRVKGGYELENKVTGETFEAVCRELLISKIYKRHDAKKVYIKDIL